jgi:hypothetical protein
LTGRDVAGEMAVEIASQFGGQEPQHKNRLEPVPQWVKHGFVPSPRIAGNAGFAVKGRINS